MSINRDITVPAGIGDSIWLLQKLISTGEAFKFLLPGGQPRRGKQVFDLLPPSLVAGCDYLTMPLGYETIKKHNIQVRKPLFKSIEDKSFYLSCNEWLDTGNRLADFFPDLNTAYTLPWQIPADDAEQAEAKIKPYRSGALVGIYTSSLATTGAWKGWQEKEWAHLCEFITNDCPRTTFVLIGAEWDKDLIMRLQQELTRLNIRHIAMLSQPLAQVITLMRFLDFAFFFPSGLPIMNETLEHKTNGVMFYPKHLEPMMTKWCHPDRTASNAFIETLFCSPEDIYSRCIDHGNIIERLSKGPI